MTLKKLSLMTVAVATAGLVLAGCSVKEKLRNMVSPTQTYPESVVPSTTTSEETPAVALTPEPTQSKSNEVKDLEVDLKAVKFDQENFE